MSNATINKEETAQKMETKKAVNSVDWKKLLMAIDTIHEQTAFAKKSESDDFNYEMMCQLDSYAQRTLYMLTRGEHGEKCNLQLELIPGEKPTKETPKAHDMCITITERSCWNCFEFGAGCLQPKADRSGCDLWEESP